MPLEDLLQETTWLEQRNQALTPQVVTDLLTTEQTRREFVTGAKMLGLTYALPHQLLAADMLNAGAETNAITFPRQSAKTETGNIIAVGRCAERPRYNAALTLATLASKTSEVFDQRVMQRLEDAYPDTDSRPFTIYRGKGSEHIRFPNGSRLAAKSPKGSSFRGSSYDFVWIDEGGEAGPDLTSNLLGGILPSFDTRDGGQLLITGTAGDFRTGNLLWDALNNPEAGKLAYQFPDVTDDNLAAWEPSDEHPFAKVRELIELTHPGVASNLTKLDTVRRRFAAYGDRAQFAREYGGVFGSVGEGAGAFDAAAFAGCGQSEAPQVPEHFALAAVPSFTGASASLVAAWRDNKGRAHGYVLDHRKGTTWLARAIYETAKKHGLPIVYDGKSSDMRIEIEALERMKPRPRTEARNFAHVTAAAALLVRDVNNGQAVHYRQPPMEKGAAEAVRRSTGPASWALGRPKADDADISAVEAWALALHYFDEKPSRQKVHTFVAEAA